MAKQHLSSETADFCGKPDRAQLKLSAPLPPPVFNRGARCGAINNNLLWEDFRVTAALSTPAPTDPAAPDAAVFYAHVAVRAPHTFPVATAQVLQVHARRFLFSVIRCWAPEGEFWHLRGQSTDYLELLTRVKVLAEVLRRADLRPQGYTIVQLVTRGEGAPHGTD